MAKSVSLTQWSLEPYCIGMKLRALRTGKRLTLAKLAVETGLSTALLSKLETDRMVPTLTTLAAISRVFGVGLSHFFQEPARHLMSITRKAHMEGAGRGTETPRPMLLNAPVQGPRLLAEMVELNGTPARLEEGDKQTCALVHVLAGRLQMNAGSMTEVLETGDCVYMESSMTTMWSAAGKQRCRILVVRPAAS